MISIWHSQITLSIYELFEFEKLELPAQCIALKIMNEPHGEKVWILYFSLSRNIDCCKKTVAQRCETHFSFYSLKVLNDGKQQQQQQQKDSWMIEQDQVLYP